MQVSKEEKDFKVVEGFDWFWMMFSDNSWEPSTFKIFDTFLSEHKNYMDIGAWIGPTVLYGAPLAKKVFAFEPDPVAYKALRENVELNEIENVWHAPIAVSSKWKNIEIGVKNRLGDSMSSILWSNHRIAVPSIPFVTLVNEIKPNFIKIDIEGGEIDLLVDSMAVLKMYKPTVHLSLHTPWFSGETFEKYAHIIKLALGSYPHILDENLKETTLDERLKSPGFVALVATYEEVA